MAVPDGHEEIDLDSVANLSIKDGELFWKGKKLITSSEIRLSRVQKIVATFLTFAVGVASPAISYFSDLENICKNTKNILQLPFCPLPNTSNSEQKDSQNPTDQPSLKKQESQPKT